MTDHAAASTTSDHAVGDHAVDIDKHVRIYITVFVALMVLTIVTVTVSRFHLPVPLAVTVALIVATTVSRFHLPVPLAVTVALIVATIKGTLVACYFMHLVSEKKLIYAVLALTAIFFIVLIALPSFTVHDGYWIH